MSWLLLLLEIDPGLVRLVIEIRQAIRKMRVPVARSAARLDFYEIARIFVESWRKGAVDPKIEENLRSFLESIRET